jgi:hypothetical protein
MQINSLACAGDPKDLKPGDMIFAVTPMGLRHARVVEVTLTDVKFLLPGAMGIQSVSRSRLTRARETQG